MVTPSVWWATRYRHKVLKGPMRERLRDIIRQTCEGMGVHVVGGVLARDHVHWFLSIPPRLSLSDVMQRIKGRASRRIQMEFPELRKRWGRRSWARGYFSTRSGNFTHDIIVQYPERHAKRDAVGVSRHWFTCSGKPGGTCRVEFPPRERGDGGGDADAMMICLIIGHPFFRRSPRDVDTRGFSVAGPFTTRHDGTGTSLAKDNDAGKGLNRLMTLTVPGRCVDAARFAS